MYRFIMLLLAVTAPASALEPKEVFILVNKNMDGSKGVAEHYCKKRGVPAENVITLDLPTTEDVSRADYNAKIVAPVRDALKEKKDQAKVLLSVYGVPLRVGADAQTEKDREGIKKIDEQLKGRQEEIDLLKQQVQDLQKVFDTGKDEKTGKWLDETRLKFNQKQFEFQRLNQAKAALSKAESHASVDSELMLLWWDNYALYRWQINLLHWQMPEEERRGKPPLMMTCRLDGPSADLARRLVDDAVEVEAKGLKGKVFVDARGIRMDPKKPDGYGYAGYDESMREMAALLKDQGKMEVVLDDKGELFPPNSCPECALYCGWYSLGNFVDSNQFVKGAVAWHLASSEAVTLRNKDTKQWCKNILEKGAAVTLGPVSEPYTIGFPKPAEFFGLIATGKYTMVECYSRTILFCSWMTVLVGDPLYKPFAKDPVLKEEQIVSSPKGGMPFFGPKK